MLSNRCLELTIFAILACPEAPEAPEALEGLEGLEGLNGSKGTSAVEKNMEITLQEHNGTSIAIISSQTTVFKDEQEAAELLMNCYYQGADALIVMADNLPPEFFDLKTRLAGEVLQKFSTYQSRLAIVGDFSEVQSKSLQDFIRESNRMGRILFVATVEEAMDKLAKAGK